MKYDFNEYKVDLHFATPVYRINRKDFLPILKSVFEEYLSKSLKNEPKNEIYPVSMTGDLKQDERLIPFLKYIANIAWDTLNTQGYFMDPFLTQIASVWGQNHSKYSSMDYHNHNDGILCVFYFLDTPSNSMDIILHDPRPAKTILGLPVKVNNNIVTSTNTIGYSPSPGDIIITNGWLPHSFSRNKSNEEYNFLHMTVNVINDPGYGNFESSNPVVI